MKSKVTTIESVIPLIKDGMTIMTGGFLKIGYPNSIFDAMVEKNVRHLTIIANDGAYVGEGVGKLIDNGQVDKIITSYIGTNTYAIELFNSGKLEVEFIPQGSLAEKIRCGGAGLGGVLTRTGVGTVYEEGKEVFEYNGERYIWEKPIKADMALVKAQVGDKAGNLVYKGVSRNFNPLMATAAETVIAEVESILEIGDLAPEFIHTPSVYVDYVVQVTKK